MNGILDDFLVGLVLMISAGYAIFSLGPRSLRSRSFAALSNVMARSPAFLGLGRMARWLAALAADKSKGACGGCDNCGSGKTPASTFTGSPAAGSQAAGPPAAGSEVRVPLAKIGKRLDRSNDYNNSALRVDVAMPQLDRSFVRMYPSHAAADDGGYMPGTAAERLSQVWELTREVWVFFRGTDAEQRLQRDVAVLTRGER
jgi:hypothetical protein